MFLIVVCAQFASLLEVEAFLLGLPSSIRQFVLVFGPEQEQVHELQRRLRHQGVTLPVRLASSGLSAHTPGIYLVPQGYAVSRRGDVLWLRQEARGALETLRHLLHDAAGLAVVWMCRPEETSREVPAVLRRLREQGALLLALQVDGGSTLPKDLEVVDHVLPARGMGEVLRYHGTLRGFQEEALQEAPRPDAAWLLNAARDATLRNMLPSSFHREFQYMRHALQQGQRHLEQERQARMDREREVEQLHQAQRTLQHQLEKQRRDLDTLLLYSQEAILLLDGDLTVRCFTSGAQRWMRLMPSDQGRPLTHVVFELPRPPVFGALQQALRDNGHAHRVLQDESGQVRLDVWPDGSDGLFVMLRDQSQQVEPSQRVLGDHSEVLRSMLMPALILDEELRVVFCNRASELFFGCKLGWLEGRRLNQVLTPDDLEQVGALCGEVFHGQVLPVHLELQNAHSIESLGDQTRAIRGQILPLELEGGGGALWLFDDLSHEQREQERNLRQQVQVLEAHNLQRLNDWVAGLAHDVNNLLTVALTNLHVLAEEDEDLSAQERADMLEESSQVTRNVRDLIRESIPHVTRPHQMKMLDLNEVLRDQEGILRSRIPEHVDFQMDLFEQLPLVLSDVAQVGRITMNLVTNAVEALNDGGGAEPLVMLATGVQELPEFFCQEYPYRPDLRPGDYVFLEVSDSGRGIAPEIMGSLFEPRVSTRGEGHGWGLANVLQLVQGMNGAVDVHTTEGAGSTFLIYLPALSEPGAERDRRTPSPDLTVAGALGDGHGYESVVLYIDDDLRLHRSVARLLRQNDFHVEVASGGREGLRRCEALGPRLAAVVLDLTMPDMNGLEVLRRLREQQPWLPVLLVSGYSERMDELPLDERTRFLEKPLMTESLASTLHDMVSLGRGTLSY